MGGFRLTHSADHDIVKILADFQRDLGAAARECYANLISAAVVHASERPAGLGFNEHAELDEGVMTGTWR